MDQNENIYSSEDTRIRTFQGWQRYDQQNYSIRPSSLAMAKAGFYFTGRGDEVQCFSCHVSIENWEKDDIPLDVHATRNPCCAFVKHEISNRPVMVPQERDYASIVAMLDQVGERVLRTINGQTYSASTLINDTLRQLGLDPTRMADSRRSQSRLQLSDTESISHHDGVQVQTPDTTKVINTKNEQVQRSSINKEPSPSISPEPQIQETSQTSPKELVTSCMSDVRPVHHLINSSETISNRQNSYPGIDHAALQDSEEDRLATFAEWPAVRSASTKEFAQAGFIFFECPDRVQCVFCDGILSNLNDINSPMEEHCKSFPECRFVHECQSSAVNWTKPKHVNYSTIQSRLSSFEKWNPMVFPGPQALAEAGLFYLGHGDNVKCFFCDGGLRRWESDDDPWKEHARFYPTCGYVKQSKGKVYIDSVTEDNNLAESPATAVDLHETHVKNVVNQGGDFSSTEAPIVAVSDSDHSDGDNEVFETKTMEAMEEPSYDSPDSKGTEESIRLVEENRQLKEQRQCKICMDEEICVSFVPCGHFVSCDTCAPAMNTCPICRATIGAIMKTYMS